MLQLQTASLLQEAAPRSHPYSTFLVKRDSNGTSPNTRHKKPTHTAKAWEAHSCFAEQADHSCFFAGDRRAQKLGLHAAQLMLEFDAGRFLDALAGQKLTLYGDSLTRNHLGLTRVPPERAHDEQQARVGVEPGLLVVCVA